MNSNRLLKSYLRPALRAYFNIICKIYFAANFLIVAFDFLDEFLTNHELDWMKAMEVQECTVTIVRLQDFELSDMNDEDGELLREHNYSIRPFTSNPEFITRQFKKQLVDKSLAQVHNLSVCSESENEITEEVITELDLLAPAIVIESIDRSVDAVGDHFDDSSLGMCAHNILAKQMII